jgi:hypothetical protein
MVALTGYLSRDEQLAPLAIQMIHVKLVKRQIGYPAVTASSTSQTAFFEKIDAAIMTELDRQAGRGETSCIYR